MKTLFYILIALAFGLFIASGVAALAFEMNLAGDLIIGSGFIGFCAMWLPDPDDFSGE